MESQQLRNIVEAALLAAGGPLTVDQIKNLFGDAEGPEKAEIRVVIKGLQEEYAERGIELREVASGFRMQVREEMAPWLAKLFEERPPRYTRALMETLAIIAYRQPVTRGDIEEIRGVAVSSNIIRTLLERDWIKVLGHRDVPGKPALFGSTRFFLDYFGLKKLDDLPPLAELAELEPVDLQLELGTADQPPGGAAEGAARSELADDEQPEPDATAADDAAETEHQLKLDPTAVEDVAISVDGTAAIAEPQLDVAVAEDQDAAGSASRADESIASLDDARDAAAREPETDFNAERAEVVPIKKS